MLGSHLAPLSQRWGHRCTSRLLSPLISRQYGTSNTRSVSFVSRYSNHNSHHPNSYYSRCLSSLPVPQVKPIRILYASQGGTAQMFAQQLAEELEDIFGEDEVKISIEGLHEAPPPDMLTPCGAWHIILASATGVGEPPDNARSFYEWLMSDKASAFPNMEFAVFGLGNSKAHPNHYNVIGKALDKRLEELGASRIMDIGLGDDGDCIEDDFDQWMEEFIKLAKTTKNGGVSVNGEHIEDSPVEDNIIDTPQQQQVVKVENILRIPCPGIATADDEKRRISKRYPTLNLEPAISSDHHTTVHQNLMDLQGTTEQFYSDNTHSLTIIHNQPLKSNSGETGLHSIQFQLSDQDKYQTGDHLKVYPQNSQCVVEAYLNLLDVDPHAIISIDQDENRHSYLHPKGISIADTFRHCVDLSALPSPAFAKTITGNPNLDYKEDIANPRRTVIDLILQHGRSNMISLEDLLYSLPPMKPRYYSIASSSLESPNVIDLVFRPVKYMTSLGVLREGVCTSYMKHQGSAANVKKDDDKTASSCPSSQQQCVIPASINSNPSFRLPTDPRTSVMMIAGGCGVAPIHAFVKERVHKIKALNENKKNYGPGQLYLGFRSPEDEVYKDLFNKAVQCGALANVNVSYSSVKEGKNVTCLVKLDGKLVWEHLENGGYTYLCGGARTFGAAMEQTLLEIIQEHGNLTWDKSEEYLRKLVASGRLMEDLAN